MARYSCSDDYSNVAPALGYEHIYLVVPRDPSGAKPPDGIRVRSRGQHDPGDGDYFCSHVKCSKSGWSWGTTAYLLSFETVTNFAYNYEHRMSWDGTTITYENCSHYSGGNSVSREVYILQNPDSSEHCEWVHKSWSGYYWGDLPLSQALQHLTNFNQSWARWGRWNDLPSDPYFATCQYEPSYMEDQIRLGIVTNLDLYLESAYVEACNSLPRSAMNNIANIGQLFGTFASFLAGYRSTADLLDSLKESWLAYRYEFLTTKSDIDEIVTYVDRMRHVGSLNLVRGHGRVSFPVKDGTVYTIRCSVEVPPTQYQDVQSWAERFGVALDGYNMWDLIPYSFIIDWFLPIGSMLETARDADYAARLSPSAVWYSITHEFINSYGCRQCDYYRWQGRSAPAALPITIIPELSKSGRTWIKRGTDIFALFL